MAEIVLTDVSVSYPVLGSHPAQDNEARLKSRVGGLIRRSEAGYSEVVALRGINLEIGDGEKVGLVGENGAGKTTLLKVLAGIYKPHKGRVFRAGRTVSVINPSVGLEPDLSGYDNIRTIGLLSGHSLRKIDERFREISEFTELGDYLDLPVSAYSAGMRTRLAFAVATAFHPEILIADENLGTGDAHFVERAKERMQAMMDASSIIVLATHSEHMIRQICNRAVLISHGEIIADGPPEDVLATYKECMAG